MVNNEAFALARKVIVVFKHSRYSYALMHGSEQEKLSLREKNDPISQTLFLAHEKNQASLKDVLKSLDLLHIDYQVLCRSELNESILADKLVITVGGDGTLLDASHYCKNSPILGINSDPVSSMGALCAADSSTIDEVLKEIFSGALQPIPIARLSVKVGNKAIKTLPVNDVMFCHKNPAVMSRFLLSKDYKKSEAHRSSGVWVATAAGSTGGIFSSGAKALPLEDKKAIFRIREPYWCENSQPEFLEGMLGPDQKLTITSTMIDAQIFLDGPHKTADINLGEEVEISLAPQPLWLFDGPRLKENRNQITLLRQSIRKNFFHLS